MIEGNKDSKEDYFYTNFEEIIYFPEIEGLISKERDIIRNKFVDIMDKFQLVIQNNDSLTRDFLLLNETCKRQKQEIQQLKTLNIENNKIIKSLNEKLDSFERLYETGDKEKYELNTIYKNKEFLSQFQEKISDFFNISNININELNQRIKIQFETYFKNQKVNYQNKLKKFNSKIQSLHNHINFLKERIPKKNEIEIIKCESFSFTKNNEQKSIEHSFHLNHSNILLHSETSKLKKTSCYLKDNYKRLDISEGIIDSNFNKNHTNLDKELIQISRDLKIRVSRLQRINGRIVVRVGGGYFVVKDYTKDVSDKQKNTVNITRIEGDQKINGTKRTNYVKSPLAKHLSKRTNISNLSNDNISNLSDSSFIR